MEVLQGGMWVTGQRRPATAVQKPCSAAQLRRWGRADARVRCVRALRELTFEACPFGSDDQTLLPQPARRRMEEVRASEKRATLEDLMYISILEKFVTVGVEMLPRLDGG